MTGDAPQPGETPRTEGNPWSFDPDGAWWRTDSDRGAEAEADDALADAGGTGRNPRRPAPAIRPPAPPPLLPPAHAGEASPFLSEAVDAHTAGVHDAADVFTETGLRTPWEPTAAVPVEQEQAERIEDTEGTAATQVLAESIELDLIEPDDPEQAFPDEEQEQETFEQYGVPEVMVLPEPERNRPTVALDRGAVPGQSAGVSRLGQARPPASGASTEASRLKMENSPFWLTEEERAAAGAAWPEPAFRTELASAPGPADGRRGLPPHQRPRTTRPPAAGLLGVIALGLIAAFFSWVSVEPFWLAVGHGDRGRATVAQCTGSGVTQRCWGSFAATDGSFNVNVITLLGVDAANRAEGTVAPARMVSPDSRQAYVGATGALVHLRWVLGFLLVLLCGLGITALAGTRRLESRRARRAGLLLSLAGPVLLLAGFLYASY